MGKFVDLTGKRFGRLTVIKDSGKRYAKNGNVIWSCTCDCGKEVEIQGQSLKTGKTQSCGCLNAEKGKDKIKIISEKYAEKRSRNRRMPYCVEGTDLAVLKSKCRKDSATGAKGVTLDKRVMKYVAYIRLSGKRYYLGSFKDIQDAIKARKEGEEKYHQPILEKYEAE